MPLPMYQEKKEEKKLFPGYGGVRAVVGIVAGKGGVGKSLVTINLARALSAHGLKVGVLDADLYGPSLRQMLHEDHPCGVVDEQFFVPASSGDLSFVSLAFFHQEFSSAVMRAPLANNVIKKFVNNTLWGELDYLLVDFPPGTGDIQLTLAQELPFTGGVFVTTPQELAVLDVRKSLDMFDKVQIPILGVIENMSYYLGEGGEEPVFLFGKGGGERLAEERGVPLLGKLPVDPQLCKCSDMGESLFEIAPERTSVQTFHEVAYCVHGAVVDRLKEESLGSFALEWKEMPLSEEVACRYRGQKPEEAVDGVTVRGLQQEDKEHFSILWSDGRQTLHHLGVLQAHCPCALCKEGKGEHRKEVQAEVINTVGGYGIKIKFASGCSHGIYHYALLQSLLGFII